MFSSLSIRPAFPPLWRAGDFLVDASGLPVIRQRRDSLSSKVLPMPRFEVFATATLIGHSELEKGDPPMGVASGRFLPLAAYEAIQPLVIAARNGSQTHLVLTVRTVGGEDISAQGGVPMLIAAVCLWVIRIKPLAEIGGIPSSVRELYL